MGAWSVESFGNDTGCDWAGDFCSSPSIERVSKAIAAVNETKGYLDSDEASECLVACEIIARLKGNWGLRDAYSEDVDTWVSNNSLTPSDELINSAAKSFDRILGSDSELVALWDEGGRNEEWHRSIDDLRARVIG